MRDETIDSNCAGIRRLVDETMEIVNDPDVPDVTSKDDLVLLCSPHSWAGLIQTLSALGQPIPSGATTFYLEDIEVQLALYVDGNQTIIVNRPEWNQRYTLDQVDALHATYLMRELD